MKIKVSNVNTPNWKEVTVKSRIPEELEKLSEIARNIWWAWNFEATELFRDLDPELWKECGQNPVLLLERMSYEKLEALAKDKVILRRMNEVYTKFRDYMDVKPDEQRPSIAYFSMEYGLSSVLKIYSGGLGVLAGDYLKEASDSNVDLCAVGFLYRYGYFTQTLSMDGQQIANYEAQNFGQLPIERVMDANGQPLIVDVPYLDYFVHANVWRVNVGRISLYLLDTDNEMNSEFDRPITHQLYGGDWENRLKQEILLGIGGILTLKALGIKKDVYHCNEGHAALINVQRICDYVATGLTFDQAIELVRASSLYTVHTPVPAGHDYFDEGLFGKYMGGYPSRMGISWDDLMDLGRNNPGDKGERFCMSVFACNTSQEVNGVSWLHGKVSQEMFSSIWKGYFPEESHVGYVTNGVHFPTWSATEWKELYFKYFNENFWFDQSNPKIWEAIYNVPDEEIWKTRMTMKNKLVDYIRKSFRDTWLKNQGDPSRIVSLMDKINPNALLIGFGRRFATYKRAHLLFTDLDRLSKIVNNPDYPVQFLFTGKAHPHDGAGQGLIKRIIEISRRPEFLGKIIFLENYDMQLARRLVSGVDIWLNTPTRPLEASGTSGEKVDVPYLDYFVHANVWRVNVGRISLYLLDTDNEMNSEFDRPITHQLYGGDWENRLKQEILLGIGGILTLKALGIKKDVYHCNEGHAALINVQRICDYVATGLTFDQAIELVRASSLYTVHTPVPAGHDYFDEGLFGKYMGGYPSRMGISWDDLMDLGRNNPGDKGERFCMSVFACNTSQEVNGVSWLHGKVSQEMFSSIWKGYFPEESHVGYVTNGVHFPTWSATEWKELYFKYFNENFWFDQSNPKIWEAIYNVPDEEIWKTRMTMKNKLVDYIRKSFRDTWLKNQGDPSRIVSLMDKINPNALLIGFGRRFATYKRAHLLFTDLDRLSKIVNNPDYPVQFLFTGKAHPHDGAGQGLIKRIIEISRRPEFLGKIIFLENYDMQLARRLVSGVDIWLNTPTRPLEASGTSGEKALMNGVVNFSVLDGWWLEGYREGAGWALTEKRTYQNQEHQDQLDAATIYSILETEILPLYYARNKKGYSEGWIKVVKNSIAQIAPHYTMKRQLDDYYSKFYCKLAKRFQTLAANDNAKAKEIAAWKEDVVAKWDSIEIVSCDKVEELKNGDIESGKEYTITYVIDEKGLNDAVGLELVTTYTTADGKQHVYSVEPFSVVKKEGDLYTFQVKHSLSNAGSFKVSYRMFPKNPELPHRQDFCYVRWFI